MKTYKKVILGIFISLLCLLLTAGSVLLYLMIPVVMVDFSQQSALTGRASGFLYGFAEDDIPTAQIAESIGIKSLATKTAGGLQHPIGDVRNVSDTFLSAGGEMLMVYTQDMYDTWYYELDSLDEYNEKVKITVTEMAASSYADSLVYCIYNEMDNGAWLGNFWEEENRYKFYDAWKDTYELVKSIDADAKIAGPGHCGYNYDFIKEFLTYCKENDCMPEVVVWHELSDQSIYWMNNNFAGYYSICDELGIERLPVCISEYGLMKTNGIPGESVKWISRLEAEDAYGCVAYWRLANNLSDTAADDVTPNSNYWVYNFYAKMKGKELKTEEWDLMHSNVGNYLKGKYPLMNKGFIALASYDESAEKFYVLTGGSDKGSKIKIENLENSSYKNGDEVTVKISCVDYKGLGGAVCAPTVCEIKNAAVKGNAISFTVPCERESQAFFIEITKGEAEEYKNTEGTLRYEAEDADLSFDMASADQVAYAVSGGECVKGVTSEKNITFNVNAPETGTYKIDMVYSNADTVDNSRVSVYTVLDINGEDITVKCPSSIKEDCMECVSVTAELKKGRNEITVRPADEMTIAIDFIDVTPYHGEEVFFEKLTSRNADINENAYSLVIPSDGYYKFSDMTDDGKIIINGVELYGGGDSVFYFGRGYNKIVLPENVSFSGIVKEERELHSEVTPSDVTLLGGAVNEEDSNTSTGRHIGWISSDTGSNIEFTVDAEKEGCYAFTIEYANNEEGGYHDYNVDLVERYITVSVNGIKQGNYFFRSTYSWDNYKTKTIILELSEGVNKIVFANDGSYAFNNSTTYAPNIGNILIYPMSAPLYTFPPED